MSQPLFVTPPFVGREREQRAYRQMLAQVSPWVMIVTGQGGLGKSALLRHLATQTPHDTHVVALNFAVPGLRIDALNILQELSGQLAAQCDPAMAKAFEQSLQAGREKLSKLVEQMSQSIVVGDAASLQGANLNMGVNIEAMREQRRQVREMVMTAFYTQLATFRPARLVLLFDTCEWLSEGDGLEMGRWVMDELLPGIHERLTRARRSCIAVIASRVSPPLTVVERQDRVSLGLPMLDQPAVHAYLEQLGMQDAALRRRAFEITRGHALCVAIIGDLWLSQGDHPFTLADLPEMRAQFTEKALIEYIQDRLDKRLASPYKELTRYGVLLRGFDLPMLQSVFPELLANEQALDTWRAFIAYPYIESLSNHHYVLHDLLREIQAAEIREQQPDKWQLYHKRALDALSQQASRMPDWYYHAIAYDEEAGMLEWWKAVENARNFGTSEECSVLLQVVRDGTLYLSVINLGKSAFQEGEFYRRMTEMDEALRCYYEALPLFRQVGDRVGEANVLRAMGDVQQFRKELEEAMQSYEQALGLYRQVGSRVGEANVLQAMGDVQQFRKELEEAMQSYEQALGLYRQVGSRVGEANVLRAMGDVQQFRKELEEAMQSYEQALGLYRQVGSRVGEANVLQAMGDVQQFRKELEEAMQSYEQALGLYRQVGSRVGEANVRKAMGDVQRFRDEYEGAMQAYEQALGLFRQVGSRVGEANVLQAMGDVQQFRKELEEAMQSYEQALGLYRQVGSRVGEANVRKAMGDVQRFRDEYEGAMQAYEQALGLFRQVGSRLGEANCYLAQGRVALQREDVQNALALHDNAYQLYKAIGHRYSQARLLYYRSYVYEAMKDGPHALEDAQLALVEMQKINVPFISTFQRRVDELKGIMNFNDQERPG